MFPVVSAYLPNDHQDIYTREKRQRRSFLAWWKDVPSYKVWIFNGLMLMIAAILYGLIGFVAKQTESGWLP